MSEFYSQLLVRYARSVLEIVPRHMFMQVGGRVWRKRVGVCVSVCLMIVCVGVCECGQLLELFLLDLYDLLDL